MEKLQEIRIIKFSKEIMIFIGVRYTHTCVHARTHTAKHGIGLLLMNKIE